MPNSVNFLERFNILKEADGGKNALIEELHEETERLRTILDRTESCLERERCTSSVYQTKSKAFEADLNDVQRKISRNAFVSVLVDGDCMMFKDELVLLGGPEAAQKLKEAVIDYMKSDAFTSYYDFEVVVHIYVNMKGMVKTCFDPSAFKVPFDFGLFAREFNMSHVFFDVIDAGDGKECADAKLRGIFELHMNDVHCKHIIFGGSADDSHARILVPHSEDEKARQRITMLEGPPFAKELAALRNKFRTKVFPNVFRHTKILTRRVSFPTTPPTTPGTNSVRYAVSTVALAPSAQPATRLAESHAIAVVPRNIKGQRVDLPVKAPQTLINQIKPLKLCNKYHLLGGCPFPKCIHSHGERLSGQRLEAQRAIARMTPCTMKSECDDEYCLSGHRCPANPCLRQNCFFSSDMHNIDPKIMVPES